MIASNLAQSTILWQRGIILLGWPFKVKVLLIILEKKLCPPHLNSSVTLCSTSTELVVFDRVSQVSLSSLSVAATLNESSSRLALHFAGLTVVSVSTAESVPGA